MSRHPCPICQAECVVKTELVGADTLAPIRLVREIRCTKHHYLLRFNFAHLTATERIGNIETNNPTKAAILTAIYRVGYNLKLFK